MADKVTITCYGKKETKDRAEAISFYNDCYYGCDPDSSECDRYVSVLYGLRRGYKEVNDSWEYGEKHE